MELAFVCEDIIGGKMAGRHLRNRSITFVDDSIVRTDNNVFDEISSLDNTAVNQRM